MVVEDVFFNRIVYIGVINDIFADWDALAVVFVDVACDRVSHYDSSRQAIEVDAVVVAGINSKLESVPLVACKLALACLLVVAFATDIVTKERLVSVALVDAVELSIKHALRHLSSSLIVITMLL